MEDNAIIIFSKNINLGTVKTRIAKTLGEEMALNIYKELLEYTESILDNMNVPRYIFWDLEVPINPEYFTHKAYLHKIQRGENLGERIENAFYEILKIHKNVLIIGTDCPYLTIHHLEESFDSLKNYDYCIGPASDGGYYLLGLKEFSPNWFRNITWSTKKVFSETQSNAKEMDLEGYVLPILSDVDEEVDYYKWKPV